MDGRDSPPPPVASWSPASSRLSPPPAICSLFRGGRSGKARDDFGSNFAEYGARELRIGSGYVRKRGRSNNCRLFPYSEITLLISQEKNGKDKLPFSRLLVLPAMVAATHPPLSTNDDAGSFPNVAPAPAPPRCRPRPRLPCPRTTRRRRCRARQSCCCRV